MRSEWRDYETVATFLLKKFAADFGLSKVEGKQIIEGKESRTNWEIDAKGFRQGDDGIIIVECRRFTTSKQSQEKMASLAYRIHDTGAAGGIMISPLGIQTGAQLIASARNIVNVILDQNSTATEFSMQFLNRIFVGFEEQVDSSDTLEVVLIRRCDNCRQEFVVLNKEQICQDCCKG